MSNVIFGCVYLLLTFKFYINEGTKNVQFWNIICFKNKALVFFTLCLAGGVADCFSHLNTNFGKMLCQFPHCVSERQTCIAHGAGFLCSGAQVTTHAPLQSPGKRRAYSVQQCRFTHAFKFTLGGFRSLIESLFFFWRDGLQSSTVCMYGPRAVVLPMPVPGTVNVYMINVVQGLSAEGGYLTF